MYPVFFFNDTATPEISTLSLHDALPISGSALYMSRESHAGVSWTLPSFSSTLKAATAPCTTWPCSSGALNFECFGPQNGDRKSTRLNSSHLGISYAVFCLKKKMIVVC